MKLGIELLTSAEAEDARTVRQIAEAALSQGHEVSIFLMDDGTYNLNYLRGLVDKGVHLSLCAHNAYQRNLAKEEGIFGSQYDWAQIVHDSDRVIVFG
ncbi:MAG: DsrE family protein [Chloroflexi bacterium]|nr:DsrE family protein [Chloroflexota bacterium]